MEYESVLEVVMRRTYRLPKPASLPVLGILALSLAIASWSCSDSPRSSSVYQSPTAPAPPPAPGPTNPPVPTPQSSEVFLGTIQISHVERSSDCVFEYFRTQGGLAGTLEVRVDFYAAQVYGAVDSNLFGAAGYYDVDTSNSRTLLTSDFVSMEEWDLPLAVQRGSCPDRGWRYFPLSLQLPRRGAQGYQGRADLVVVGGPVNNYMTEYLDEEVRVTMAAEVSLRKVSG